MLDIRNLLSGMHAGYNFVILFCVLRFLKVTMHGWCWLQPCAWSVASYPFFCFLCLLCSLLNFTVHIALGLPAVMCAAIVQTVRAYILV